MDLKHISANETATLDLMHPLKDEVLTADNGDPMSITVYGPETNRYKKAIFDMRRKLLLEKATSFEDGEKFALEMLVAVTVDWHLQLDGKNPKCEANTIRKLYVDQPWIKDQVDKFVHERANFLSVASTG